jgi:hypothetical protein
LADGAGTLKNEVDGKIIHFPNLEPSSSLTFFKLAYNYTIVNL